MGNLIRRAVTVVGLIAACLVIPVAASAQQRAPLKITITEGVIEALPFAVPDFVPEDTRSAQVAADISRVIVADLVGSGLFREVPKEAHIGRISSFGPTIQFADWTPINVQALVTGSAATTADGRLVVKFRLWDVFAQQELGAGQQFAGPANTWRRMAHKVADQIYSRLTGESGYFDSRIVFVSESGPKNARRKRLAMMDQDGANLRYLTDENNLVLVPRWSPDSERVVYTSYETGLPQIFALNSNTLERRRLTQLPGFTSAPSFSADASKIAFAVGGGINSDLFVLEPASGRTTQLTRTPAIETQPSFSPDGSQIVFESDRSGTQQIYIMPATGGEAKRISFGEGRYATPVWSPRGDLIAFTKIAGGRFHIGVMRTDGSNERLLTASFKDEGPSWSPNGRVIVFFRETAGASGAPALYSVDITGRNLRRIPTPSFASDPHWSGLLR